MAVKMSLLTFITVVIVTLTLHSSCMVRGQNVFPRTPCPNGDKVTECASATTGLDCIGTDESDRECQCPATKHFHYVTNKCLYSVTKSCAGSRPADVTPNAVCENNVVTCTTTNYHQTPDLGCALSIGDACNKNSLCDQENFKDCPATVPRRCSCLKGSYPVAGDQDCRLDYGSVCEIDTGAPGPLVQKCPDDSYCELKEGTYRCFGCPVGLVQIPDGKCVVPYGEECTLDPDLTRPCDEAAFMECDVAHSPNLCQCKNPGSTWYNAVSRECDVDQSRIRCTVDSTCVDIDPVSDNIGLCICNEPKHGRGDDGLCIGLFGALCTTTTDCKASDFLTCIGATSGVCEYNAASGKCELFVDEICDVDQSGIRCAFDSTCVDIDPVGDNIGVCRCNEPNLGKGDDGLCIGLYEAPCAATYECKKSDFLTCVGVPARVCECDPSTSLYNSLTGKCELLEGESCSLSPNNQHCAEFSECSSQLLKCKCLPGYSSALNRTCILAGEPGEPSYGAPCEHANDCSRENYLECGPDKTCECHFDSWFNPSSERCELLVRSPCIPDSFAQSCTEYAECLFNTNAGYICLCNEDGFVASADKRCVHQSCGGHSRKLESFLMRNSGRVNA